jgi:hypothetical protein
MDLIFSRAPFYPEICGTTTERYGLTVLEWSSRTSSSPAVS